MSTEAKEAEHWRDTEKMAAGERGMRDMEWTGEKEPEMLREQPESVHNIFDTVFRTIIEYLPGLIIPVINEIFGAGCPADEPLTVLKNEHITRRGTVVTDLLIELDGKLYHVELQSLTDARMTIRIFEYATAIAIERMEESGDGFFDISYPNSCVIYLRAGRRTKDRQKVRLTVPGGGMVMFEIPVLKMRDYTKDDLFRKNLLMLLPYYLMRYEDELKEIGKIADQDEADRRMEIFLREYEDVCRRLETACGEENRGYLYLLIAEQVRAIAEYLAPDNEKERVIAMGGTVIKPQAQMILEEGIEKGIEKGLEEGIEKGELKKARTTALRLSQKGMSVDEIADAVEFGVETVKQWLMGGMAAAK